KDPAAAIIQLKTALQGNSQSAEARYLLGKALLDSGDAVAAAVELRKAAELKYQDTLVTPALAKAMLLAGEDRKVAENYAQVTLSDAAAQADLKTTLAAAYARQDKRELTAQAIADALAAAPDHAPAKIMKARMSAGTGDFPAALALLDDIITREPGNTDAWLLKGEILHFGTRDQAAALAAYRKAVEGRGDAMAAHQGIVTLLIAARELDAAQAHVAQLKKTHPNHPQARMLDAQMAFLRKDYQATRELTAPLLQLAPNNPLLLQLAGAAEFNLRSLPQAETLLAQAVKLAPGLPMARQLLARTYLRTGQADKALETLRPVIEGDSASAEMVTLAAEAYLHTGDVKRAEALFTRASKAKPDDPRIRTALALSQIGKGNSAAGLAELEAVSAADDGVTANLALVTTYLRRNELDKALKAIDTLERKQADKPLAANLRGRVLMMRQDAAGARRSFEQALQLDPVYFPAVASLAALDLTEKK
ncbi:MAG: PEP-CTERM system TPR-repeat protein PrsT, partial [Rubrivivax sp.]|nr:PEP-CTERM system TPR-repeat protein PrsT [Rubrivivax sp.]